MTPTLFGTAPPGWTLVETPSVQVLRDAIEHALAHNLIVAADGPSGSGKTTAARYIAQGLSVPPVHIKATNAPTVGGAMRTLLAAMNGGYDAPSSMRRDELVAEVSRRLRATKQLVIVDEAARLRTDTVEALLMLHDDGLAEFAICLSGTGMASKLRRHDHLMNRVSQTVPFVMPTRQGELITLLRQLHPVLRASDDNLLSRIHVSLGPRPTLREWEHITRAVLRRDPNATEITDVLAVRALADKGLTLS